MWGSPSRQNSVSEKRSISLAAKSHGAEGSNAGHLVGLSPKYGHFGRPARPRGSNIRISGDSAGVLGRERLPHCCSQLLCRSNQDISRNNAHGYPSQASAKFGGHDGERERQASRRQVQRKYAHSVVQTGHGRILFLFSGRQITPGRCWRLDPSLMHPNLAHNQQQRAYDQNPGHYTHRRKGDFH
jgi:hypothetical protein